MIAESSFHRWRNPQCLVNPAEVVMQEIKRNHVTVVLKFLAESVRQPREAPHRHTHREILALHERRADVLRIGIAAHRFHIAADARCWTVAALVGVGRSAVDFMQHRVIDI